MEATTPCPDWRDNGWYKTNAPCCVCGSKGNNGIEPRFGYVICEKHKELSPIQINDQRTDGK